MLPSSPELIKSIPIAPVATIANEPTSNPILVITTTTLCFNATPISFWYASLTLSKIGDGFSSSLAPFFPPLNFTKILGTSVIATISDNDSANIRVLANAPNIILVNPSVNIIGRNIATVVSVDATMALVTVFVPSIAASSRSKFGFFLYLKIFSITTVALSTTIPTAITSELSVTIFKVSPVKYNNAIEPTIDVGIAIATTNEALVLFKKANITAKAIIELNTKFFITSLIELVIYSLVSFVTSRLNDGFSLFNSSTTFLTFCITCTVFASCCFCISTSKLSSPLYLYIAVFSTFPYSTSHILSSLTVCPVVPTGI